MNNGIRWSQQDIAEAIRLRKAGRSLSEISHLQGVSKSSLHRWLKDVRVPEQAKRRLRARGATGQQQGVATILRLAAERKEQAQIEAHNEWKKWSVEPLFMLGIGLYWGEGSKTPRDFSISNSDEGVHRAFLSWLKHYAPQLKLRATVAIHSTKRIPSAIGYWKRIVGDQIPIRGHAAISRASKGKRPRNKLPYGTLSLSVGPGAAKMSVKMAVWLSLAGSAPQGN